MHVSIIVLNYNGWQHTIECINSLLSLNYESFDILIVDNNSTDMSVIKIKDWLCSKCSVGDNANEYIANNNINIRIIMNASNVGYAAGNNIGIKKEIDKYRSNYIWLLNNDTVVESNALQYMVNIMEINHDIAICGSKIIDYYNRDIILSLGTMYDRFWGLHKNVKELSKLYDIDGVQGCSMFIRSRCINIIGLLPEEYFMYFEESDYCLKAKISKFKIVTSTDSIVYHKEGAASGVNSSQFIINVFNDLLCLRNRLICGNKYLEKRKGLYLGMIYSAFKRIGQCKWGRAYYIIYFIIENIIHDLKIEKHMSIEKIRDIANKIS